MLCAAGEELQIQILRREKDVCKIGIEDPLLPDLEFAEKMVGSLSLAVCLTFLLELILLMIGLKCAQWGAGGGCRDTDSQLPGGGGEWAKLEWQNLAQQKCTKFCHGVLRTGAIFLGVIFSTLGMQITFVTHNVLYRHPLVGQLGATAACILSLFMMGSPQFPREFSTTCCAVWC